MLLAPSPAIRRQKETHLRRLFYVKKLNQPHYLMYKKTYDISYDFFGYELNILSSFFARGFAPSDDNCLIFQYFAKY